MHIDYITEQIGKHQIHQHIASVVIKGDNSYKQRVSLQKIKGECAYK